MKITVIGANGKIGKPLCLALFAAGHDVKAVTRADLDLLRLPDSLPDGMGGDVVYLCAAMSRFIDCESNPDAYRVNVDAVAQIAQWYPKMVYLSSEAAERAIHTAYGMHKALAESAARQYGAVIARLGWADSDKEGAVRFLVSLATVKPGVYRWQPGFARDDRCSSNAHGCRLVSDGAVCQERCEWLARTRPAFTTVDVLLTDKSREAA